MSNSVYSIFVKEEGNLNDYINYQVEFDATNDIFMYARSTTKAEDLLKVSLLLYPEFIVVEDVVLFKCNYSEKSWNNLRSTNNVIESANINNHIHLDDFFPNEKNYKLIKATGDLLVLFWNMALKKQFKDKNLEVSFDGEVIQLFQHT